MKLFSDISIWWLIPWAILSVVLTVWYYRSQKEMEDMGKWTKRLLMALRGTALFLLGALIIGLLFEVTEQKSQRPVFITLTDNSASMLNYSDSLTVKRNVDQLHTQLKARYGDDFDFVNLAVGNGVNGEKVSYSDQLTDLDAGFEYIYNTFYNQNIGGICFISDGNYNKGKSPVYSAEKIAITPIFSIGVGDTAQKRDQIIRNVGVNDVAFFKNQFPVEVDIQAVQMGQGTNEVSIYKSGKKIATESVKYENGKMDFAHLSFFLEATEIGFVQYTVEIKPLANESSLQNNKWTFYVEVIDSRSKILMLASAPHPDVAAIKSVIDKDENVEVKSELTTDWSGKLEGYELLIWHEPGVIANSSLIEEIKRTRIPVWYLIGSQSSSNVIDQLGIGVKMPRGKRTDEAQVVVKNNFQLFDLTEETKKTIASHPPLSVPFGGVQSTQGEVLFSQRIGPVEKKDPVLVYGTASTGKFGVLIGEGLWKWKIAEFAKKQKNDAFIELIQKSVQYLTVKKNTDALRINLPKRFTINDDVIINGEFYNSSFDRITTPTIAFVLTDEKGDKVNYQFAKNSMDYRLVLGKLKSGQYSWVASASYDGKKYTKNGLFVVEDISLERINSSANHNLLNQLAMNSNGKFYTLANAGALLDDISKRGDIVTITYEESAFNDFIDYKWVFFLIVLLLASEWFIRRRSGSY